MSRNLRSEGRPPESCSHHAAAGREPGKITLTERMVRGGETSAGPDSSHEAAAAGIAGASSPLPHLDAIQRSFGPEHDVGGIEAHVGGPATGAAAAIGAEAYACGNHVAFRGEPTLHTAAHEAAHVMQQRSGVFLQDGLGDTGDVYEQHADAVADLVVRGESAAPLLRAGAAGSLGGTTHAVQRQDRPRAASAPTPQDVERLLQWMLRDFARHDGEPLVQRAHAFAGLVYAPLHWYSRAQRATHIESAPAVLEAGQRFFSQAASALRVAFATDPQDGAAALTAVRAAPWRASVRADPIWASFESGIQSEVEDAASTQFLDRVTGELSRLQARANAPRTQLQPAVNSATSSIMESYSRQYRGVPPSAAMRQLFYAEVLALIRRTRSGTLAVCFMRAMTDVMITSIDDADVRTEVPVAHRRIRDLMSDLGLPDAQVDEARDAYTDAVAEKTRLMDADIHRNAVELQYIVFYTAIRQAVQSVGDAWIERKTRHLRQHIADVSEARTWVGRGVNVAWSLCEGPDAAFPLVLLGTIVDIFLELEADATQDNLTRLEARLRTRLSQLLESRLGNISEQAMDAFQRIDRGLLPAISRRAPQTIGQIEAVYSTQLRAALGA